MRFLYLTDTHCRGTSPVNRKDDFVQSLYLKMEEVAALARELEVKAILHGGDLWDFPNPSLAEANSFVSRLRAAGVPIYIIAGNHDLRRQDLDTLSDTMLGIQGALGKVRIVNGKSRVYFGDKNVRVQITGQSYHSEIDRRDPRLDYCIRKQDCDYAINLVHGMLMTEERFPGSAHTHVSQVHDTEADLTLVGHMHFGFADYEYQGKRFLNIGALSRLINHLAEIHRPIQVLLVDLSNGQAEFKKIHLKSALPGCQVLDKDKAKHNDIEIDRLARSVFSAQKAGEFGVSGLQDLVDIIGVQEGFGKEIRIEALRRLHSEIELAQTKPKDNN
jgi:DNA repair exonuclease SbcCD nuclease subunit